MVFSSSACLNKNIYGKRMESSLPPFSTVLYLSSISFSEMFINNDVIISKYYTQHSYILVNKYHTSMVNKCIINLLNTGMYQYFVTLISLINAEEHLTPIPTYTI